MSKALHLNTSAQRLMANMALGSVAAVIGATTTAITTSGTPALTFDGILSAATAQTNLALLPLTAADLASNYANWAQPSGLTAATAAGGFYVQPANTTVYYVVVITPAGNWRVVQGTFDQKVQSTTLDPQQVGATGGIFGGYAVGKSVIPDVPDGVVPVAIIKVVSGGSTFTVGTTSLGTAGQSSGGVATIKNVTLLPAAGTF